MIRMKMSTTAAAFALSLYIAGCGGSTDTTTDGPVVTEPEGEHGHEAEGGHSHEAEGGHEHASEGPHHGTLVEFGDEKYHGEVVHGEDGTVTVYILDGTAAATVAIDATEVTINVSHDGQPEQFVLAASPDTGDAEGKSSRFVSSDAELGTHLDEEGATARLAVTIDGTPYSGAIEHHHDHDHGGGEHGHEH
jgi:hypothetical protein